MTSLNLGSDSQGHCIFAPASSSIKYNATLAANTATTITVPNTYPKYIACFTQTTGSNIWVDLTGATAVVPSGSTLAPCTAEQNPGQRTVLAGSSISIITSGTGNDVGVILYASP